MTVSSKHKSLFRKNKKEIKPFNLQIKEITKKKINSNYPQIDHFQNPVMEIKETKNSVRHD